MVVFKISILPAFFPFEQLLGGNFYWEIVRGDAGRSRKLMIALRRTRITETLNNICSRVCFRICRVWSAQFILQSHKAHTESGTNLGDAITSFHLGVGVRGWRCRGPGGSQKIKQRSAVVSFPFSTGCWAVFHVRVAFPSAAAGMQDVFLDIAMPAGQGRCLTVAWENSTDFVFWKTWIAVV